MKFASITMYEILQFMDRVLAADWGNAHTISGTTIPNLLEALKNDDWKSILAIHKDLRIWSEQQ